ncbi:PAS domain S-box protein [Candidatus Woesearchaeota archaeon]|nr:PAS domain S-box protein [Candidatus Woesearchaeota archaeon]
MPSSKKWFNEQLLNQIQDAIISTDLEGNILSWNKRSENLFGYKSSEIIGEHISILYLDEDRDLLVNEIIKPLKEKGLHQKIVRLVKKNKETVFVRLLLSMLKDKNGKEIGMIGSSIDIIKEIETKKDLMESEERLSTFYKAAFEGIAITRKGIVLDVNQKFLVRESISACLI